MSSFAPGAFPEQSYARQCPSCRWITRKYEYDETPFLEFCPSCGIPMERMACVACGAPVVFSQKMTLSGYAWTPAPCCGFCGAAPVPVEPQHRIRPPDNSQLSIREVPPPDIDEDLDEADA